MFLGIAFTAALMGLVGRIGFLKYAFGEEYEKNAILQLINNNNIEQIITPRRGEILDRNMLNLGTSTSVYDVIFDVRLYVQEKEENEKQKLAKEEILTKLSEKLDKPLDELKAMVRLKPDGTPENDTHYYTIEKQISRKLAKEIDKENLKHVHLIEKTKRTYVHNNLAPQVLGFYRGEYWGLEKQYNKELSGVEGRSFRKYDNSNNARTIDIPATDGYTLITTIDLIIQQFAEAAVLKAAMDYNPQNAAIIVMNSQTGEVLAMAQYPSFDPNFPSKIESINSPQIKQEIVQLEQKEQSEKLFEIWANFNITKTFEPGSIFKPVTVAAALEEGKVTPQSTFYCGGGQNIAGTNIPCWYVKGHGTQTLAQALSNSCNVAMFEIVAKTGKQTFYDYQRSFGYGELTGIDFPGEVHARHLMYTPSTLRPVELATSAMGQSFNNTAIQAITAFSAAINGGNLMKPYLVSQIIDSKGNVVKETTPTLQRKVISKETSNFLRSALQMVVSPTGTGKKAYIEGYPIGGKTGTGQQGKRSEEKYTLSFAAYLPVDNTDIVVLAMIHIPEKYIEGTTTPSYMIKDMMQNIIRYKGVLPSGESEAGQGGAAGDETMPLDNYVGLSIIEATHKVIDSKLDFDCVGSGTVVVSQTPAPNTEVVKGTKIYLYLSNPENVQDLALVPNVKGLNAKAAVEVLTNAGFNPILFEQEKTDLELMQEYQTLAMEPVTYNAEDNQSTAEAPSPTQSTGKQETTNKDNPEDDLKNKAVVTQMPSSEIELQQGTTIKLIIK